MTMTKIQSRTGMLTLTPEGAIYDAAPFGALAVAITHVEPLTIPVGEYTHGVTFVSGAHVGCLVTAADAATIATWRAGLKCCHDDGAGQCATLPTHGIYPDDGGDPYRGSHACTAHVGALLYEGRCVVTPIGAETRV